MEQSGFSQEAKELLKDVIDTEHQARCSLVTSHAGTLMVLGVTYDEAVERVDSYRSWDELNCLLEWETFIWTGERGTEMWLHKKSIRAGWIIEIVEVTDEQWTAYVTDHLARTAQQAMQQAQSKFQ